jgi:hypothetical protein
MHATIPKTALHPVVEILMWGLADHWQITRVLQQARYERINLLANTIKVASRPAYVTARS